MNQATGILDCVVELMKHCKIRRSVKWDDRGVASTVGTIMALLVFLTFMSLIVDQYVPVWMKDAESAHMNEAFGQFGNLKTAVDNQIQSCRVAKLAQRSCMRIETFIPMTLGVDGVPLFASPTVGELSMNPHKGNVSILFSYEAGNYSIPVPSNSSGNVELHVFNRYFVQQRMIYENGGILVWQADGQLVGVAPHFTVYNRTDYMEISLSQTTLYGSGGIAGVSTEGASITLANAETEIYKNLSTDFNITLFTDYERSWFTFYNSTLFEAFGDPPVLEVSGSPTNYIRTDYFELAYNDQEGLVRVRIYNQATFPIEYVELVTSAFDVEVGEIIARVG